MLRRALLLALLVFSCAANLGTPKVEDLGSPDGTFGGLSLAETQRIHRSDWPAMLDRAVKRGVLTGWKQCGRSYVADFAEGPYTRVEYVFGDLLFQGAIAELRDPPPWREGLQAFGVNPPAAPVLAARLMRFGPEPELEGCGLRRVDDLYESGRIGIEVALADGKLARLYRNVWERDDMVRADRHALLYLLRGTDAQKLANVEKVRSGGYDTLVDPEFVAALEKYYADLEGAQGRIDAQAAAAAVVAPPDPLDAAFGALPIAARWTEARKARRAGEVEKADRYAWLLARSLDEAIVQAEKDRRYATAATLAVRRARWQNNGERIPVKSGAEVAGATGDSWEASQARVARLFAWTVPPIAWDPAWEVPRQWLDDQKASGDLKYRLRVEADVSFFWGELKAYPPAPFEPVRVEFNQVADTLVERFGKEERKIPVYADRGASESQVREWAEKVAKLEAELATLQPPGEEPPEAAGYETYWVQDYTGQVSRANISTDSEGAARRREWEWRKWRWDQVAVPLEHLYENRPIRTDARVTGTCSYPVEVQFFEGRFAREMVVRGYGETWRMPLDVTSTWKYDKWTDARCAVPGDNWTTLENLRAGLRSSLDGRAPRIVKEAYPAIRKRAIAVLGNGAAGTPEQIAEERAWIAYWTNGGPSFVSEWPSGSEMKHVGAWPKPR